MGRLIRWIRNRFFFGITRDRQYKMLMASKRYLEEAIGEIHVLIDEPNSFKAAMIKSKHNWLRDIEKTIWYGSPKIQDNGKADTV